MGAANCPETPRQRMIGMMYLVLTAMLALNVSKDILDAFVVVDETLITSNSNTELTINSDYSFLDSQKAILGEEKVRGALSQADELKKASDELVNYLNTMKSELLKAADNSDLNASGQPKSAGDIQNKDDYSRSSKFFINDGNAEALKKKILEYRNNILQFVPANLQENYNKAIGLDVEKTYKNSDGQNESWETHNFDHVILIATFTLLNKMVGEVRNAESTVLKQIISSINADDFKFDRVDGRAVPKSQMVFAGENYQADIIVMAYDSKQTPEVYYKMGVDTLTEAEISGAQKLEGEEGLARLILPSSSIGDHKYAGLIKIMKPDGKPGYYGFKDKYTVIKPSATVAADKMNVLYAGIENPLSVSAPVAPEKLSLSIPGCQVTKTGGGWNASVPLSQIGKQVTATVNADVGGRVQPMGNTSFRVKKVPDPVAYIGANIKGGRRTKQELMANDFVVAKMGDDFVYDMRWTIKSYRVIFVIRGTEEPPIVVSGNRFSDALKQKINSAPGGTSVYFTDIKASSPAGERTLNEIAVRIR